MEAKYTLAMTLASEILSYYAWVKYYLKMGRKGMKTEDLRIRENTKFYPSSIFF